MTSTSTKRQIGLVTIMQDQAKILEAHAVQIDLLQKRVTELEVPLWKRFISRLRS